MLSPVSVKSPSTTTMIEMTIATIGRRMKNSATGARSLLRRRLDGLRAHDQAVADAVQTVDDDALARLQPLVDHPLVVDLHPRLDLAGAHRVAVADDRDLVRPLHLLDRALRDDDRVLLRLEGGAYLRELPGTDEISRVREEAHDEERSRLHVDLPIRDRSLPALGVDVAVGEDELEPVIVVARRAVELDAIGVAQVLLLADRGRHLDRIDLRDRGEHAVLTDEIAHLRDTDACDAGDRRLDLGPVEIELRLLDAGARRVDRRLRGAIRLHGVVELLLADRAFLGERRIARDVLLRLRELRFGAPEVAFGGIQRGAVRPGVDREEQRAGLDQRSLGVALRLEIALHARPDLCVDRAVGRAD